MLRSVTYVPFASSLLPPSVAAHLLQEFRYLISFVAPLVKERKALEHQREVFDELDADNSGGIDADELRAASRTLKISLDHVADRMGDSHLGFDDFRKEIEMISSAKKHEAAALARASKEGFLFSTYKRLCLKDGSFTLGSFRKSLAAIGMSLSKEERLVLFERIAPPPHDEVEEEVLSLFGCQ